jgi:signal transduction histidine kinase
LPLVLIAFRSQWQAWFLLIYSVIYFVLWSRNMNFLRYLMPVFAAYAILCVSATQWVAEQLGGRLGRALYAVTIIGLALIPSSIELFVRSAVPGHVLALQYAAGTLTREQFYADTPFGPTYHMSEYCNRMLDPAHSRVRFFGCAQTYYVHVPHVPDGSSHGELHDLEARAHWDEQKFRKLLEDRGITHIVFDPSMYWLLFQSPNAVYGRVPEVRAKAARSVEFFQHFAIDHMELVHKEGPMLLFAWKQPAVQTGQTGPYTGSPRPQP